VALAACAAAAFWTSAAGSSFDRETRNAWHHYEYLAEGFFGGHTYLSVAPDRELLALRDPYDSTANTGHKLWDASLYQGRYYLYFGPAPALLMLPWHLVTGHVPAQRMAVAAAAAADLAGLALLLWDFRRRHFPGLRPAALAAVLPAAFFASWLPVLLVRSAVWELPIVSGVATLTWSVYFLWQYHASGGRALWAVLGGAALAVLIGCRVTHLFSAGLIALLYLVPCGEPRPGARWAGGAAGLLAAAGGLGLLLYNHERFGEWLEFGQRFQLWGRDYRGMHFFSPAFIPFNVRAYFLSLPQFGPYFPFVHPFWPDATPSGYMETEDLYGILFMMPVHVAGLAACAWAWRSRGEPAARPAALAVAAAAGASVLSGLILLMFGGACSRYTAELLGGWTLVTAVGLTALFGSATRPPRWVRAATLAAAVWSLAAVTLAAFEYRGYLREAKPQVYGPLARTLNAPSAWWAARSGVGYGPVALVVRVPPEAPAAGTVLLAAGRPQMLNFLMLIKEPDGRVRLTLALNEHHVLDTPAFRADGGVVRIRLDAPWLYPPADHPYWDRIRDPAARPDSESLFSIDFGAGSARIHSSHSADAVAFAPTVLGAAAAPPGTPFVESILPAP
jgi:hypothetical protein